MMADGETYRRWAEGACPCCGGDLEPDVDGQAPAPIGEGVQMCGRCIANRHHLEPPSLPAAILEAILFRSERPIEELLESAQDEAR